MGGLIGTSDRPAVVIDRWATLLAYVGTDTPELSVARFVLSAPATSDLREIHDSIATDDPTAPRRVLGDLRDEFGRR